MYWRLISLKKIIQIWDTWKSVMGLQVRAFKNWNKWTSAYKDHWTTWTTFTEDWNTPINLENNGPSSFDLLASDQDLQLMFLSPIVG